MISPACSASLDGLDRHAYARFFILKIYLKFYLNPSPTSAVATFDQTWRWRQIGFWEHVFTAFMSSPVTWEDSDPGGEARWPGDRRIG